MLILMNVIVVGIEKISMAQHHVSEWVIRLIQILGVPAEDIEDGPTAMHASGHIAISIEIGFPTRILQTFDFLTLWVIHKCDVGIGVATWFIEVQTGLLNA